ncbi:MAG: phosphoribosylformylglycinamidine synthase [Flavobacteriaceae bacterium]|tara:strand:+ start:10598 stop:14257 length:3660 start_codon:yes stop_codon:yes gene_type:complete
MVSFFESSEKNIFAVQSNKPISELHCNKLQWLFGNSKKLKEKSIVNNFIGPRSSMISPWSTNAVEMCENMGIDGIARIEKYFYEENSNFSFDPMTNEKFKCLDQNIFKLNVIPQQILEIKDISKYNLEEGLALSQDEIEFLNHVVKKIGRNLTDSEVFGFSQVNSEHCRHKIFNGTFIIDNEEKKESLFSLIKKTSKLNSKNLVSAYKDNVAFIMGPKITQFAPKNSGFSDYYESRKIDSVISLKAETHNFPTTVEPFNGAATGSGGEIRDRLAGGKGSLPIAGTAVYMTPYSRISNYAWEKSIDERNWLYQNPSEILIKASNGASDFGNKFGQPLICGSILTFENKFENNIQSFDKVIMLAGGIGYANKNHATKGNPKKGDLIVILGGDNYKIGMGGAAVSSADTGNFSSGIELNAVQRSNPEMQKRVANAIRGTIEDSKNCIISIHDHGAGGHLNCLTELVEETGGFIELDKLPIGDPSLSNKEIIGNESQERMGLIINKYDLDKFSQICKREKAPMYVVGEVTNDKIFEIHSKKSGKSCVKLELKHFFGSSPKTILKDTSIEVNYPKINYKEENVYNYLESIFKLESVGCKDWLTNKVDRCVGGRIAKQQCAGELQLPLNNCGVVALDFIGEQGIATSIGHSPISALINPAAGSKNSIAEALTNIIWAPLNKKINGISLSANWMWPCKNTGEDARLFKAVEAASKFAIELGINIPTGKDSLSMSQKYKNKQVKSPGTVIISATSQCTDINNIIEPVFKKNNGSIYYINISSDNYFLGGSALGQIIGSIGKKCPSVKNPKLFVKTFNTIQELIVKKQIVAGHDVGSGGLITTIMEMCFASVKVGAKIDISEISDDDIIKKLFSENVGLVFQSIDDSVEKNLIENSIEFYKIGEVVESENLIVSNQNKKYTFNISEYRDIWFKTSTILDRKQTANQLADVRFNNYKKQPLNFIFPEKFSGNIPEYINNNRPVAAILREKGSNSERELANALHLAGFMVKDIHMTDLISGKENLKDINFLGAVGGFSNSDVLGSAKGWAGSFKYNKKAKKYLTDFFKRKDTLSIGICNGCQLFMELDLIYPTHENHGKMTFNNSQKHESNFTSVNIIKNNSVMLKSLEGLNLGVWISHGEGKFVLPDEEENYNITATYSYNEYPSNPNGSDFNTAMLCSHNGRHLVTMPHIERSIFKWNWAYYPNNSKGKVSPWIMAFINARNWILKKK